ncbi:hypothetical protein, partial [Salmonella sp. SAL4433]|uniref:hypothetical protein n=1 Tax=Salmonella sp. SAL4433 TaxID=3159888 RepID=UPI00397E3DCA
SHVGRLLERGSEVVRLRLIEEVARTESSERLAPLDLVARLLTDPQADVRRAATDLALVTPDRLADGSFLVPLRQALLARDAQVWASVAGLW